MEKINHTVIKHNGKDQTEFKLLLKCTITLL